MRFALAAASAAALTVLPVAAHAQAEAAPEDSIFDGDYITLGIGIGYGAQYEGADEYEIFPAPLIRGKLGGVEISPRPGGLALDLIPDAEDPKIGFSFGPVIRYRANRTGKIKDPQVAALGELDAAVEIGANAGVTVYKLLSDYDALTLSSDLRYDIAGAHKGQVIAPGISYFTPVSRGAAVVLSFSGEFVDDKYADYYFSVSPAGALASGLPVFQAKGGLKSYGPTLLGAYDFDGNLLNGGLSAFALAGYSRLAGDARRTPLTSQVGDASQWIVGGGLAYSF
ncbi:MAG: MipA/OmpV family protein [Sphingomonadales bacterium]|nr:MipA/OmpV family protein [Sphingomonadales bacterium]